MLPGALLFCAAAAACACMSSTTRSLLGAAKRCRGVCTRAILLRCGCMPFVCVCRRSGLFGLPAVTPTVHAVVPPLVPIPPVGHQFRASSGAQDFERYNAQIARIDQLSKQLANKASGEALAEMCLRAQARAAKAVEKYDPIHMDQAQLKMRAQQTEREHVSRAQKEHADMMRNGDFDAERYS